MISFIRDFLDSLRPTATVGLSNKYTTDREAPQQVFVAILVPHLAGSGRIPTLRFWFVDGENFPGFNFFYSFVRQGL